MSPTVQPPKDWALFPPKDLDCPQKILQYIFRLKPSNKKTDWALRSSALWKGVLRGYCRTLKKVPTWKQVFTGPQSCCDNIRWNARQKFTFVSSEIILVLERSRTKVSEPKQMHVQLKSSIPDNFLSIANFAEFLRPVGKFVPLGSISDYKICFERYSCDLMVGERHSI